MYFKDPLYGVWNLGGKQGGRSLVLICMVTSSALLQLSIYQSEIQLACVESGPERAQRPGHVAGGRRLA